MEANAKGKTMWNALRLGSRMATMGMGVGLLSLATAAGCQDPEQDKFVSQGGISPDPTARLEGSVLYIGPRPRCVFTPGEPPQIVGRVVLTMFAYNNPPPPEGTATSALNLLYVDGEDLFYPSDCLAEGEPTNYDERITRSAPFQWPRLPLAMGKTTDLQIRGFYDYDEDMVPFFSVSRLPTAGDIVGASLNDIQDASKGFFRITLPRFEDAEQGAVIGSITVALGNVVRTERPAFQLDANRRVSAETPFPMPVIDGTGLNGPATLEQIRATSCATGPGADGTQCGLTLERIPESQKPKLDVLDVGINFDPAQYAFYAQPVDVKTVVQAGPDVPVPDGKVDPHPFLGGLGIPWYTPIVLLTRVQTPIEVATRVPGVIMSGSVLMTSTTTPEGASAIVPTKASYLSAPIGLPPVAAVELIPGRNDCRVPYFPRGSSSLVVNNRVAHCSELPSGRYATNVFAGIAGGQPVAAPVSEAESGQVIVGGRYSGQSWSIPNELGDKTQVEPEMPVPGEQYVVPGQGIDDTVVVYDPDPANAADRSCGGTLPIALLGQCEAGYVTTDAATGFVGADSAACLPSDCCEHIAHLCAVPRCAPVPDGAGGFMSGTPAQEPVGTGINGAPLPSCIPFDMPWQCCP